MRLISTLYNKCLKWSKHYANLPEEYINSFFQATRKPPPGPQYNYPPQKPKKMKFTTHRPWTFAAQSDPLKSYVPIQPINHKNWCFFPGDHVEILEGKDKGKQGIVRRIYQERNWITVEGLNTKLERLQIKGKTQYVEVEKPLLITNGVRLIDPDDRMPTEIQWRYSETGERIRISVRSGRHIPMPKRALATKDYLTPGNYKSREKDTEVTEVEEITFQPVLKTFEMDIMDKMAIKEDRVPVKTYWY